MKNMEEFIPLICGLKGTTITKQEEMFLREYRPWGIILFERNCISEDQIKILTDSIKKIYGTEIPILIDQEGGRVSRLNFKGAFKFPSATKLFNLRKNFAEIGDRIFQLNYKLISTYIKKLGINVNSIPVLDIPDENESGIIGDRSFSNDREIVASYGSEVIDILNNNGVAPIIKHMPGHGRADVDSHLGLPYVHSKKSEMSASDFYPFKFNSHCVLGMTAHIIYSDIDEQNVCTFSKKIINQVLRDEIGFKGTLITDDISMKAINLPLQEASSKALEAGCDVILHCNGNINEMNEIANCIEKKHYPITHQKNLTSIIFKENKCDTKLIDEELKELLIKVQE